MDYTTANEKLQGRNKLSRKVANNTYLVRNSGVPGDSIHLKLHNTYIITWYADGRIKLNTGGWFTVTTKARINEFLSGYSIGQERGVWYLSKHTSGPAYWTRLGVFADGLTIHPDDSITGMSPLDDAKEKNKLRRQTIIMESEKLYQELAVAIQARKNCDTATPRNTEWFDKWTERINELVDLLPHDSGIDCGTKIDLDASHAEKIVLYTSFHHMHESGMYDGWTEHTIVVTPSFSGINLRISGRNRNDIKEYLYETFEYALTQQVN